MLQSGSMGVVACQASRCFRALCEVVDLGFLPAGIDVELGSDI